MIYIFCTNNKLGINIGHIENIIFIFALKLIANISGIYIYTHDSQLMVPEANPFRSQFINRKEDRPLGR